MRNETTTERISDRELVTKRVFYGPPRIVFDAWDLLMRRWAPKAFGCTMVSCELDLRVGGTCRFAFSVGTGEPMVFHGRYLEVSPPSRLKWTNEEAHRNGEVTTVTFQDQDGKTLVVVHELYPSKEALDTARASGSEEGACSQHEQLDELLPALL